MSRRLGGLLALALAAVLPLAPATSNATAAGIEITAVDTSAYPEIALTVSAPAGADGAPQSFSIREDRVIRPVRKEPISGDRLEVAVVIDTSGSMKGSAMAAAKDAATRFVAQLPAGTRVAVIGFGDVPSMVAGFDADPAAAAGSIAGLQARGETALYDAVATAVEALSQDPATRRSIVLLSDGADTVSGRSLEEAEGLLVASGATLQAIHLQTADAAVDALRDLASAGRGEVRSAVDGATLQAVYDALAADLRNQHVLRYTSRAHDATTVEVRMTGSSLAPALTTLSLPAPAAPQAAPRPDDPGTLRILDVDHSAYPNVRVSVLAPRGLADIDLETTAFELLEEGRAADVTVQRVDGAALEVVVAVDVSGSMKGAALEEAKAAAAAFLDGVPPGTEVALLAFSATPEVLVPFTDDLAELRVAIAGLDADGETSLYDAAVMAGGLFAGREPASRSVVLFSDGGDTVSSASAETAAVALANASIAVHAVQLHSSESDLAGLRQLTTATSGEVAVPRDGTTLSGVLEGFAQDVGNHYVLQYRSTMHGEADIEVGVAADGVTARAGRALLLPPLPWFDAFLGSSWALRVGAATVYAGLTLVVLLLLAPKRIRLSSAALRTGATQVRGVTDVGDRAKRFVDQALRRRGRFDDLNTALERAGVMLRPAEFVLLGCAAASILYLIGTFAAGRGTGFVLAAAVPLAGVVGLRLKTSRRRAAFSGQLGDTLQMLSGSLRTGYGLLQSVDAVAKESDSPTAEEFRRLVVETRLGRDLDETLQAMAERIDSEDFRWVVQAMEIHREIGGDLAEVLDQVAHTIRERDQVIRQAKALSAEGRLSAVILLALPFVVVGGISLTNPSYMDELFTTSVGHRLIATGVVLMVIGAAWLSKVVKPRY